MRRAQAVVRILQGDASVGRNAEPTRGLEVDIGRRLGVLDIIPRDDGLEALEQPGLSQVPLRRRPGGGCRNRDRQCLVLEKVGRISTTPVLTRSRPRVRAPRKPWNSSRNGSCEKAVWPLLRSWIRTSRCRRPLGMPDHPSVGSPAAASPRAVRLPRSQEAHHAIAGKRYPAEVRPFDKPTARIVLLEHQFKGRRGVRSRFGRYLVSTG